VAIDRRGWFYGAAEAGAHFSTDGGKSWKVYQCITAGPFERKLCSPPPHGLLEY
jgi:hypothetical protein